MNILPAGHYPTRRAWGASSHFLVATGVCFFTAMITFGQEPAHPLKPPDRSSPRAALKTFLEAGDTLGAFVGRDYLPSPSRAKFHHLISLVETWLQSLDLSEVPPAARGKTGRAAAIALYETLSRIQLPPLDEIPDAGQLGQPTGTNATRWVIPHTEIALKRVPSGPRQGEFLFSPETVANADHFYDRVHGSAYTRPVSLENLKEIITNGGGWLVPYRWIQALPAWLRTPLAGQAGWKWIALVLVLGVFALFLRLAYRLSHRGIDHHPFLQSLAAAALPAFLLLATPVMAYLAAQPTIENLIGGLSLFADKPIRVGDFCRYGEDLGTVEAIGIRSTRIRGIDRTLTTMPNAALSKMPVVNLTARDRMLIKSVIGIRYETSPEQLRYLLVKIRELLLSHPRIHPDPARARFIGYGASSLDIEVFAYVTTRDWAEFLGVREDVLLRIMDIIKESGTAFALPSQRLYFARDQGLNANRINAAEAQVRNWREEGRLPFPDFSPEQKNQIRGSLVYPPTGSP